MRKDLLCFIVLEVSSHGWTRLTCCSGPMMRWYIMRSIWQELLTSGQPKNKGKKKENTKHNSPTYPPKGQSWWPKISHQYPSLKVSTAFNSTTLDLGDIPDLNHSLCGFGGQTRIPGSLLYLLKNTYYVTTNMTGLYIFHTCLWTDL